MPGAGDCALRQRRTEDISFVTLRMRRGLTYGLVFIAVGAVIIGVWVFSRRNAERTRGQGAPGRSGDQYCYLSGDGRTTVCVPLPR